MRVRRGTYENGEPVRWIETRTLWEFNLHELIDGLCSHYVRDRVEDDDGPLPDSLTLHQLVKTAREQYEQHGTANVWTWTESSHAMDEEAARTWARGLILAHLPDLEI